MAPAHLHFCMADDNFLPLATLSDTVTDDFLRVATFSGSLAEDNFLPVESAARASDGNFATLSDVAADDNFLFASLADDNLLPPLSFLPLLPCATAANFLSSLILSDFAAEDNFLADEAECSLDDFLANDPGLTVAEALPVAVLSSDDFLDAGESLALSI